MKKSEMTRLVKMAVEYGEQNTPKAETPKEGYFAIEHRLIDREKQVWMSAKKWWNDNAERYIPGLEEGEDEACNLYQEIETLIWKRFKNRCNFVMFS